MKTPRTKDPNPLVQVTILRERLKSSLMRERRKSKALNAMRNQLLAYAKDLKRVLDQRPAKNDGNHKSELTAAWAQLLLYARDLKVIVNHERKNGKDLQKAASVLKHLADVQKNRSGM